MKIAIVTPVFSVDAKGGIENHVLALANELQSKGVSVKIIQVTRLVESSCNLTLDTGVKVVTIRSYGSHNGYAIFNFKRFFDEVRGFDIIHLHDPSLGIIALTSFACRYFKRRSLKLVHSSHGYWFHNDNNRRLISQLLKPIYFAYSKYVLNAFDSIIAVSSSDYENACKLIGNKKKLHKVTTIENPIRYLIDKKNLVPEKSIYVNHKGPVTSFSVLSLGRNVSHKNYNYSIRILKSVAESLKIRIEYHLVGKDTDHILSFSNQYFSLIAHGTLDKQKIIDIALSCNFVCSLSTFEGFGLSIYELMNLGLIPIYSNIPAYYKIYPSIGVQVNLEESDTYSIEKLSKYFSGLDKISMREQSKRSAWFTKNLSWRANIYKFQNLYREILDR